MSHMETTLAPAGARDAATMDGRDDGPLVLRAAARRDDPAAWAAGARDEVEALLARHRALLFRGYGIDTVEAFQGVMDALRADLLEYTERSTPRSQVEGRIYTSTEYPKAHEIPMHNENSYSARWPRRIAFCCLQPAEEGGATPIADSRAVFAEIPADARDALIATGVAYSRNFGQGVDLSWQEAFQTEDPARVEAYCREAGIAFEWFDDGEGLHTEQVRPAAVEHTATGERIWFNQAHLFHVSSLEPALRQSLTALFPPERLPRHAFHGDGSPIREELLHEVREAYRRTSIPVEWERGDLLLLDNRFYAHGRKPFSGARKVVVGMDGDGRDGITAL